MKPDHKLDEAIAQALYEAGEAIDLNEQLLMQVKQDITLREKKERPIMKKYTKFAAVCALLLMTTTAAYAASTLIWSGHSDHRNDITEPPSVAQMNEAVGYAPKYVAEFANGWAFKYASIIDSQGADSEGNVMIEQKNLDFTYTKGRAHGLALYTRLVDETFVPYGDPTAVTIDGQDRQLYYSQQTFKFVPPSYQLTDEDQAAIDSGELAISYGSNEINYSVIRTVMWLDDGISYELLSMDVEDLDKEDLIAMAQEVIAIR